MLSVKKIVDTTIRQDNRIILPAVAAGFPSPAADFEENSLNIGEYIVKNPESTFFVRASGDSMVQAGILPDSILVVDKSRRTKHNSIVIVCIDGDFTVKRLQRKGSEWLLKAENPAYKSIKLTLENHIIWGVVTFVITSV